MESKTFRILTRISEGYTGEDWGTVRDADTREMFGSIEVVHLEGEYIYIYERINNQIQKEIEPDIKVIISEEYGDDLCVLFYKIGS